MDEFDKEVALAAYRKEGFLTLTQYHAIFKDAEAEKNNSQQLVIDPAPYLAFVAKLGGDKEVMLRRIMVENRGYINPQMAKDALYGESK